LGRALGWSPPPLTVREARRATSISLPDREARSEEISDSPPLLDARSVRASYGDTEVLHGVDVQLRPGEIVALVGRNGAGKSTLLRCLSGLHEPTKGTVHANGHAPEAGRDVALCPQTPEGILFKDSVEEEIATTLKWSGSNAPAERFLDVLGLVESRKVHPRDLSAGQRLLVAVAAIASTDAPVLLLDEPTRGLDHPSKERLSSFLRAAARSGKGVIFATHDVELVAELAHRVVMLAGGEVIAEGSPAAVIGDSPVFAPQTARVFGPQWLTPDAVIAAVGTNRAGASR
ncbi:MAG: energy-coupling factor transport system ATP-binding protein, partial [Actinomycetota bacterium]|nr:energy-coupling factor transport system ATP-binding protein [Actinomycetota bacterium]